jgi:hypothetical protein
MQKSVSPLSPLPILGNGRIHNAMPFCIALSFARVGNLSTTRESAYLKNV